MCPIYLLTHLPVHLPICLSIHPSVYRLFFRPPLRLSVFLNCISVLDCFLLGPVHVCVSFFSLSLSLSQTLSSYLSLSLSAHLCMSLSLWGPLTPLLFCVSLFLKCVCVYACTSTSLSISLFSCLSLSLYVSVSF